jgi:hypothetical protein
MAKKKKKVFTPVFYYSGSNITKKTWKQICKMIGQGVVVYMTSGAPINPPPYPPK